MTTQAVILIDHGSAHAPGDTRLGRLASIVAARIGLAVYPAHLTGSPPTLADAVAAAVADGADGIIVAPCLLGSGRHVTETIPGLVADVAAARPDLTIRVVDALDLDDALAAPIAARIRPHIDRQGRP